jgi:hypothetical protein
MTAPPFTEVVDRANGRVSTRGPLPPVAADPLAGTAEQLRRSGRARVVVDVRAGHPPDEGELCGSTAAN